jgi:hypothetical protein
MALIKLPENDTYFRSEDIRSVCPERRARNESAGIFIKENDKGLHVFCVKDSYEEAKILAAEIVAIVNEAEKNTN